MEINLPNLADIERDKKYKVLGVHLDIPYDLDSDGLTLREIRKMKRDDFIKILSNGYVFALNCASEYIRNPDENLNISIFIAPRKLCTTLNGLNQHARKIQRRLGEDFELEEGTSEVFCSNIHLEVPRLASSQPLVSFDLPFPLEDRIDSSCIVEAYVYPAIPSQRKNDKGRHICQAHDGFYTRIIYYGREKKGLGDLSKAHFEDPIRANEDFTLYNGKGSLRKVFS